MRYATSRLIQLPFDLLLISVLVFILLRLLPGDPALLVSPPGTTASELDVIRRELGLDRSVLLQLGDWLGQLVQGDLGRSVAVAPGQQVLVELIPRFIATLELTAAAMAFAIVIGVSTGIAAAMAPNSWVDGLSRIIALLGVCTPAFWLGLLAIIVFSVQLDWLPTGGRGSPSQLILPAMTLAFHAAAIISRNTRSAMLEVRQMDFVRTATAKGLPALRIVGKHALRNALLPVITVAAVQFGHLMAGAVVVETVFAWPGVGRALVSAISFRDYPLVQGIILLTASTFIVVNLVTDLLYGVVDPRVRVS